MQPGLDLFSSLHGDSIQGRKFRNSVDRLQNLKIEFSKLRTSLSSAALTKIHHSIQLKQPIRCRSPPYLSQNTRNSSPHKFIEKLDSLREKVQKAKQSIRSSGVKQIQALGYCGKEDETTFSQQKPTNQKTEREGNKPFLTHYTSMKVMPVGIKDSPLNPYLIRSHKYYISELVNCMDDSFSPALYHLKQSMQMLLQYKLIRMSQENQIVGPNIKIPRKDSRKKTLFLDLDETLIHCFETQKKGADIHITINLEGSRYPISFNIRPYAITFLKKMKKKWEIVVFTASHQSYADAIIDEIDPDGTLFDWRLYRQHCRELAPDLFIKDLSWIDRDPTSIVLVDNSSYSYAMQLDNGIPILPFYEGKDFELQGLESYLNQLIDCEDVREKNREYFKLGQFSSFEDCRELIRSLYVKKGF